MSGGRGTGERSRLAALRAIGATLAAITLGACAAVTAPGGGGGPAGRDPAGRIIEAPGARPLEREALYDRMATADVVYLGEKHDNAWQHERQREVVEALVARGRRPAIGFEMFPRARTSRLMLYVEGRSGQTSEADEERAARRLRRAVGWSDDDQRWAAYGPLLEAARAHGLPAFGIDLPVALRYRMVRVGIEGLTPVERELLEPGEHDDPQYRALMIDKLRRMHCGHGGDDYLDRLYRVWLARNETMAASIARALESPGIRPIVVIVGGGHIQHRMGVVERLASRAPAAVQVDLGFLEVERDPIPLERYVEPLSFAGRDWGPAHSVVWLSPRGPEEHASPCAS